jgi:hypothetical protein
MTGDFRGEPIFSYSGQQAIARRGLATGYRARRRLPSTGPKQGSMRNSTMTKHRQGQAGKKPLWVFAQYPVRKNNVVIPIEAASREEAIHMAEADPRRIGKLLTPQVVAGHQGFTDGERTFVLFEDVEAFQRFLHEELTGQN